MTIHNLTNHLSWLLKTKPQIPPPDILVPPSSAPQTSRSQTTVSTIPHVESDAALSHLEEMARLRTAPLPPTHQRTLLCSPRDQTATRHDNANRASSSGQQPVQRDSTSLQMKREPQTTPIRPQLSQVEAIDLTGPSPESPDTTRRYQVAPTAGTKRRSDDAFPQPQFEPATKTSRRNDRMSPNLLDDDDAEFANLDDLIGPPPPYSKTVEPVQKSFDINSRKSRTDTPSAISFNGAQLRTDGSNCDATSKTSASSPNNEDKDHTPVIKVVSKSIAPAPEDKTTAIKLRPNTPSLATSEAESSEKLRQILALSSSFLSSAISKKQDERQVCAGEAVEQMDDNGTLPMVMQQRLRLLKSEREAMESMQKLIAEHQRLTKRKVEHQVRIQNALLDSAAPNVYQADVDGRNAVRKALSQTELELLELFDCSGLNLELPIAKETPHESSSLDNRDEVLIRSTPTDVEVSVNQKKANTWDRAAERPSNIIVREAAFDDLDELEAEEEDKSMFEMTMGSPPPIFPEPDEDFDGLDDEDFMLEMAEDLENNRHPLDLHDRNSNRKPFHETSGNEQRYPIPAKALLKSSPIKSSNTNEPSLMKFAWSADVKTALTQRFKLRGFRQNQLPAINATLSGKDVFVLMPTGGGKSLCYQLPSIIRSGKTRGVTVVISPLLSLMEDQVQHLRKLDIQAYLINGELTQEARKQIMDVLRDPRVEDFIQILYVTPELLAKSQAMSRIFENLHRRNMLARIVIDEAHCVSQWGHDFRPDYKQLGELREKFEGVPTMALTATATENVKMDVMHNLGIQGCEIFTQTFNRPNLYYEVRPKGKAAEVLSSISDTIKSTYRNQSGIIYCLSRKDCEKVAATLRKDHGIKAHHYHAGMEAEEKKDVQKQWQAGRFHVIVATIAFGMGIDKPDVRFVFHHSVPKSLEGYYQETGRAGRDGKRSGCYLYYAFPDISKLRNMIDKGEGSREQKQRQHDMLRQVSNFCDNRSDCRRVEVLQYFGERFAQEDCQDQCDNCRSDAVFESQDFTELALAAIKLVEQLEGSKITLLNCIDILRGRRIKKGGALDCEELEEFGAGRDRDRGDVERVVYRLLTEEALQERNEVNRGGFPAQYIHKGRNARFFLGGQRQCKIQVRISSSNKKARPVSAAQAKRATVNTTTSARKYPLSTNVSSPIQAVSERRGKKTVRESTVRAKHNDRYEADGFVINDHDDGDEVDEDDDFEPIRIHGRALPEPRRKRRSMPISADLTMDSLTENHRMVVDNFLTEAKRLAEDIRAKHSLRATPFTDTVLRVFAINFPESEEEMLDVPGIDEQRVRLYGSQFFPLIRQAHSFYDSLMSKDEVMQDPNHQTVIDLCDSEGEADQQFGDEDLADFHDDEEDEDGTYESQASYVAPATAAENIDDDDDLFDNDADEAFTSSSATATHTSRFFPANNRTALDVQKFQADFDRANTSKAPSARAASTTARKPSRPPARGRGAWGRGGTRGRGRGNTSGGSGFKRRSTGVTTSSRVGTRGSSTTSRAGHRTGVARLLTAGGVAAMPT